MTGAFLFEEATPERLLQHAWLKPHFLTEDGRTIGSIHCFVIESEGRTFVVDTCVGNDKPREVKNWHLDTVLADLVAMDHRITSEVYLEPTPGHTPGHVSVRITSRNEEAVITGDLMHHPVQCAEPAWASRFDVDPDAARRTRRAFLERHADRPVLVLGTHFAAPTCGRIARAGAAFRLV